MPIGRNTIKSGCLRPGVFDLTYCALNVIMIMTDKYINEQFCAIKQKQLPTYQNRILDKYTFWLNLKEKNKDYSKLFRIN
jgi:hypothetical protein